jgi:hypothetical protein
MLGHVQIWAITMLLILAIAFLQGQHQDCEVGNCPNCVGPFSVDWAFNAFFIWLLYKFLCDPHICQVCPIL